MGILAEMRQKMKELTNEEKIIVGRLWNRGHGIHSIAIHIHDKRNEIDEYYLAEMVAEELIGRVEIDKDLK